MKLIKLLILFIPLIASASERELDCLAKNIYYEARGESALGQMAVALVTLNRVHSKAYPNSICRVVYQPDQFSWTSGEHYPIKDKAAYIEAKAIARYVYKGYDVFRNMNEAIYYHSVDVHPSWAKGLTKIGQIDNHVFYK